MSRSPAELAREVRDALYKEPLRESRPGALAALAELEAQAEAGQRLAKAVRFHRNEQDTDRSMVTADARLASALDDYGRAAAVPSPADDEETA